MTKHFDVPEFYRAPMISALKELRAELDPKRRDLSPSVLDFGAVRFLVARHFGFCYGVENAIDIAYRAVAENAGRRIFLLSEMIHNPGVNADLAERGVRFLMQADGRTIIDLAELGAGDIVVVPAFGTTVELQAALAARGIDPYFYDTTCPFVHKVWKRAADLGKRGFTVVVHGKRTHEETRATFSHSRIHAPTIVVRNLADTRELAAHIRGERSEEEFWRRFADAVSVGFDPLRHLERIGVVNQTTMLATETHEISETLRRALEERWGTTEIDEHFADTRDTLCYATYENQSAVRSLVTAGADLALVIGGYNSSNTSHLVELCAERMPTFFVRDAAELLSRERIRHFDLATRSVTESTPWLPATEAPSIALTSGASCPDATVAGVIERILGFFPAARSFGEALADLRQNGAAREREAV